MRVITGVCVAIVAVALASPAALAAPAPSTDRVVQVTAEESLTLRAKVTSTETVSYGAPQGIGDLTVTQGSVRNQAGKAAGSMTMLTRVVSVRSKGSTQMRDTQVQVRLAGGQVFAQAVASYSAKGQLKGSPRLSVTGGTGAYATAHGSVQLSASGAELVLAYDFSVNGGTTSTTMKLDPVTAVQAKGDAVDGIGNVTLSRAARGSASYVSVATRVGSTEGRVTKSIDLQVFMDDGSIFSRTVAHHRAGYSGKQAYAVLGGTGAYKGVRGEIIVSNDGRSLDMRLLKASGKSTATEWWENNGDGVEGIPIVGGTTMGLYGKMYDAPDAAKVIGGFYVTRMQYDQVDGVTPVVTMLEQDFGDGKMLISGITLATGAGGKAVTRPIIGGTGTYLDADGQVSSSQEGPDLWKKQGRFWR